MNFRAINAIYDDENRLIEVAVGTIVAILTSLIVFRFSKASSVRPACSSIPVFLESARSAVASGVIRVSSMRRS